MEDTRLASVAAAIADPARAKTVQPSLTAHWS
ncbi:hypothetical protein EV682_11670 [Iodobacter fluviatilis]|uniref:Uncharacterized protein n=1 Tax=Iodobacter fluviatilis TaxID=537 RepID=A0A377SSX2_9NEIS|nr:hypothetical protein EV682_11670 [Iodobacter fluviatilis]STR45131.1 Uncharacterised protein [Iodobacter fluviatilis]